MVKQSMVKAVGGGSSEGGAARGSSGWAAARGFPRGPGAAMCGSRGLSCTASPREVCHYSYLTGSVHKVVLRVSIPAQMRQLFFISVITMDNLTDLCGNCLLENDFINTRVVVYRIPAGGMPLFNLPSAPLECRPVPEYVRKATRGEKRSQFTCCFQNATVQTTILYCHGRDLSRSPSNSKTS